MASVLAMTEFITFLWQKIQGATVCGHESFFGLVFDYV